MSTDARETGFTARVHQGHAANFRRKIDLVEDGISLDRLLSTIGVAAQKQMITDVVLEELQLAADNRRRLLRR